jgi:hypothetical protein
MNSWGNTQVNTTTKPLFEETLNIVFECFDKYKRGRPILPIECLNNYQLIYNENNDKENLERDDNQVFTDRTSTRYLIRDLPSRSSSLSRTFPRINASRTSTITTPPDSSTSSNGTILPSVPEPISNKNIELVEPKETLTSPDNDLEKERVIREPKYIFKTPDIETEKERLLRLKSIRAKYTFKFPTRPLDPFNTRSIRRSF